MERSELASDHHTPEPGEFKDEPQQPDDEAQEAGLFSDPPTTGTTGWGWTLSFLVPAAVLFSIVWFGNKNASLKSSSSTTSNGAMESPTELSPPPTTTPSQVVRNELLSPPPTATPVVVVRNRPEGCVEATLDCIEDHYLQNTHDRLTHDAPLHKGQALCNKDEDEFPGVVFQFGLAPSGALVWQKCSSLDPSESELIVLRDPPANDVSSVLPNEKVWFQMTSDATWQIVANTTHSNNSSSSNSNSNSNSNSSLTVVWEQAVQNRPRPIQDHPRCLNDKPVLDCPYIHFRRHGDIIMNYIDPTDGWVACKSRKKCYPDLWD